MTDFWKVDYHEEFSFANAITFEEKMTCITSDLSFLWSDIYKRNSPPITAICRFSYGDFMFIFDDTGELISQGKAKDGEVPEGRVIAAYGISKQHALPRNNSRMKGYLGATSKIYAHYGNDYDKGHFIANATGGPMEINLFPQKRHINRGWSSEGKQYRRMEKFVTANPGMFVFSRPVYNDMTLRPYALEFGYITTGGEFTSIFFENI